MRVAKSRVEPTRAQCMRFCTWPGIGTRIVYIHHRLTQCGRQPRVRLGVVGTERHGALVTVNGLHDRERRPKAGKVTCPQV